ncbi:glycosyltransferase family 4 protein [Clostridium algidicarnis]|uniref:Glycosyltransferase family 4 protein n=1 Tax=Clostridium algidicarnis TaxID=37659 RepID=A0ABS6C594_9CLOT|nr:glycosyltransferase family 4 protein [Clostridium algidicarnis]MBU3220666.1 glycosyltransferase family 4 protein [Clostridium algidicarnis]
MKNIWIFNHYISPPSIETGHRHNKFAKYLVNDGYNVKLFFSSVRHNSEKNVISDDRSYSIEETNQGDYIAVKTRNYKGNGKQRVLNMIDFFCGLFKVTKSIKKQSGKPDIIYASSVHPLTCVAGILIAKRYKVKCIVEIRDLWPLTLVEMEALKPNSIITKLLYRGEKWIYKKADSIIFTMEGGKQYIKDRGWDNSIELSKVYDINNGIDLDVYHSQKVNQMLEDSDLEDDGTFKVVYAGSIIKSNVIDYLVKSAEQLSKEYKDIKLLIYGDGTTRAELEDYCKNEGLKSIIFKGRVDKKDIPYILSKSNLNVMTGAPVKNLYKYGASLNKMFDYMASEKPILSNIECEYDILEKYNCGITVKGETAESLTEGILKFYNMEKEKYNEYCQNSRRAAKDYDFRKLTDKLEMVISETLKNT